MLWELCTGIATPIRLWGYLLPVLLLLLLSNTKAHDLRIPKHEGLYRNGRRCGRHNLLLSWLLHRPLIGGMGGGAASPSRVSR